MPEPRPNDDRPVDAFTCPRCREDGRRVAVDETWGDDPRAVETILRVQCPTCLWGATYRL